MKSYKRLADIPEEPKLDIDLGGKSIPAPYLPQMAVPVSPFIGAEISTVVEDSEDYLVKTPGGTVRLVRDVDFGRVGQAKQPSLLKSGAEKVAMGYGLLQHYTIEDMHQDFSENPVMFYLVKCELVKIGPNGQEYVFTTGYGSANTKERRNGRNNAYDAANSCIKMAQKRALTAAALSISGLSSAFTQDMESEDYINDSIDALNATKDPTAPINIKQKRLLFARIGALGLTTAQGKKIMVDAGFPSVNALTQQDFAAVLQLFETPAQKEAREAMKGEPND